MIGLRLYLIAGALAAIVAVLGYAHHRVYASGYVAGKASMVKVLDTAQGANQAAVQTIGALQQSIAECTAGRVFDRAQEAQAMATREADNQRIARDYKAMRARMAKAQATVCASWAQQASCGVTR